MQVRQVRVWRNVLIGGAVCALILWQLRDHLWPHRDALGIGCLAGVAAGCVYWRRLQSLVTRRDRRYERNKIFVRYLSVVEILIAAVAYNHYLAIPLGVFLLAAIFLDVVSAHWWTILASGLGLTSTLTTAAWTWRYERCHGPLYYQYNSETWSGAEGMLYQAGTVVAPLCPKGKVKIQGVLWNAVSLSGETIEVDEEVEVISLERLTLYVDRLTPKDA